jgi:hypothetical protein
VLDAGGIGCSAGFKAARPDRQQLGGIGCSAGAAGSPDRQLDGLWSLEGKLEVQCLLCLRDSVSLEKRN